MSLIIDFKLYQSKFKKKRKNRTILGCDIVIFPGIRYSSATNVGSDDKNISKIRKSASLKRPGTVTKRGA
jgi:hypothetical protein